MPFVLRDKRILLISPNEWGTMHVSKHHYALELARRGNVVYFLNPPSSAAVAGIQIRPHGSAERLFLVDYSPSFPLALRFRFRRLYDFLMRRVVRRITRAIGMPLDIVWSFEPNLFSDLRVFNARTTIFHPVDQVTYDYQVSVARSADLVIAVAEPILTRFDAIDVPKLLLGHGLAACYSPIAEERACVVEYGLGPTIRAGYVGNLWMGQIDRIAFRAIVESSPDVEFHIWGPLAPEESNVSGGASPEALAFLAFLRERPNVRLLGVMTPERIASAIGDMDLLLLCYDVSRDPNGGANSHKLLEYLSTGRVVVANPVSSYRERSDLLRMTGPGEDRDALPKLFRDTVEEISQHNRPELQRARATFALAHTYARQIERIEAMLAVSPGP